MAADRSASFRILPDEIDPLSRAVGADQRVDDGAILRVGVFCVGSSDHFQPDSGHRFWAVIKQ